MASISKIIDIQNDSAFYNEVRYLLGIEAEDMTDTVIQSDIMLGMAERDVCKVMVPNWQNVISGSDAFAQQALRSVVICKLCLNILKVPAIQNIFVNELRIIDIVMKSNIDIEKLKNDLTELMNSQLSIVGVEHPGDWPEFQAIGMTDSFAYSEYYISNDGDVQEY